MNRSKLLSIARAAATRGPVRASILAALHGETGRDWNRHLGKLARWLEDTTKPAPFTIFADDGNSKLPFAAFSAMPGEGFCPGAGDCLDWCYSFRAWRYPAAFARQLQNSILLESDHGRAQIVDAFTKLERRMARRGLDSFSVRLYVDGDFRTTSELAFWRDLMHAFPRHAFYGYSKSFAVILEGHAQGIELPANYRLNLSGGHNADATTLAAMSELPCTRGEFKAVSIGRKVAASDHGTRSTNAALRAAYGKRAFTCPGKCGACLPSGDHACGSERFKGVDIIIAVH